jgi:hypothetical protein
MNRLSRTIYIICTVCNIIMAKFYLQRCCCVCMSPCELSLGNRSLVTSEARQPGQTSLRPLTISSLTIWWPVWAQLSNSQLKLQLSRRKTLHRRRSLPWRSLEDSRWLASVVRRLLVLVLARDLVAFLILSRLGLVRTLFLSLSSVWPPASGGKLESPGPLKAVTPGVLVHVMDHISGRHFLVDTGSALNIIPHSSSLPTSGWSQLAYLSSAGERYVELWLSGQHFKWTLFQSEIQMAT